MPMVYSSFDVFGAPWWQYEPYIPPSTTTITWVTEIVDNTADPETTKQRLTRRIKELRDLLDEVEAEMVALDAEEP